MHPAALLFHRLTHVLLAAMMLGLVACNGADPAPVWPEPSQARSAPVLGRARALGVTTTTAQPAADQVFNWAEREFPQWFPGPASNLVEGPWVYRSYLSTGVMLGLRDGDVYVIGGPFGASLLKAGRAADVLKPPLPVWPTSYENKHRLPFDATQVPTVRALGIPKLFDDEGDSNERSVAFADFFQEGEASLFVTSGRVAHTYGPQDVPDIPGVVYFLKRDAQGQWVDRTSQLLRSPQDRVACVSASYALVADFNEDGKPDVFISCTGVDYWYEQLTPEQQRVAQTAQQVLLLSQRDGSYRRSVLPGAIYGHQATAFDVDSDGHVDIVTTDAWNANERLPFVWRGQGDGRFARDDRIITTALTSQLPATNTFWNVFGVPRNGKVDLILAGQDVTVLLRSTGGGGFDLAHPVTFRMPTSSLRGKVYQFPLDLYWDVDRQAFYFHSTASGNDGEEWAVLKFDGTGVFVSVLDTWVNFTATLQSYSAQFKATASGDFVAYTGGCWQQAMGACSWRVKR